MDEAISQAEKTVKLDHQPVSGSYTDSAATRGSYTERDHNQKGGSSAACSLGPGGVSEAVRAAAGRAVQ